MTIEQAEPATLPDLPRVHLIIWCERGAEGLQWKAAELIAGELADGKSQRELAREIGKSQPHVFRMNWVWQRYVNVSPADRPSFNAAYNEANPPGIRGPSAAKQVTAGPAKSPPIAAPDPWTGDTDDSNVVDGEIVPDKTLPSGMTQEEALARIREGPTPEPPPLKAWDSLRKANSHLLAVCQALEAGVPLDSRFAGPTVKSFFSLTARISACLEDQRWDGR
jgi:hypothetical protein